MTNASTLQSIIAQVKSVEPLTRERAVSHTATTRREAGEHGHSMHYRSKEDEHLTRSNCAACVIGGYGADKNDPDKAPNHCLWFRDYVTLGRAVPSAWLESALLDSSTNRNESALNLTLQCLRTFGLTTYLDGVKVHVTFDSEEK